MNGVYYVLYVEKNVNQNKAVRLPEKEGGSQEIVWNAIQLTLVRSRSRSTTRK